MGVRRSSRCYWTAGSKGCVGMPVKQGSLVFGLTAGRILVWIQGRSDTRPRVKEAVRIKPMIELGAVQRRQKITQVEGQRVFTVMCHDDINVFLHDE